MISGSVRDAEKPIIIVAPGGLPSVWLRVRGSHDVQSSLFTAAHQQDGYPDATESRCSLSTIQKSLLDGGVHTRLLDGMPTPLVNTQDRSVAFADPQSKVISQGRPELCHVLWPFLDGECNPPDVSLVEHGRRSRIERH